MATDIPELAESLAATHTPSPHQASLTESRCVPGAGCASLPIKKVTKENGTLASRACASPVLLDEFGVSKNSLAE